MIDEFETLYIDFNMKICELEGVDEEQLEKLLDLLDKIQQEYALSDSIPKKLAGLLMDIHEIPMAYSDYYKTEAEKQNIFEAVDMLAQKAHNICFD